MTIGSERYSVYSPSLIPEKPHTLFYPVEHLAPSPHSFTAAHSHFIKFPPQQQRNIKSYKAKKKPLKGLENFFQIKMLTFSLGIKKRLHVEGCFVDLLQVNFFERPSHQNAKRTLQCTKRV